MLVATQECDVLHHCSDAEKIIKSKLFLQNDLVTFYLVCVCLCRMQGLDIATAVRYLSESDTALQVVGAAYIQHQCYHSNDAKNQVRVNILYNTISTFYCLMTLCA